MSGQQQPPRWTHDELEVEAATAIGHFRHTRMQEPLQAYLDHFEEYRGHVETLIESTAALGRLREQAVDLLSNPAQLTVIRYLASPAISEDDLKVLAEATLSRGRLRADPALADRIIDTVLLGLDRERFGWAGENRPPTDAERAVAVVSTAALIATQKVQTQRRNDAKKFQEQQVADALIARGLTQVPPRTISNLSHLPNPGEFCGESMFGTRKADLVVRLHDGRAMPTECKVSNSSTNSVKRLNNDAAIKAETWLKEYGTANCVPAAVLSGVFKIHNLTAAQDDKGLTLFWAHRLDAMIDFIELTKP